MIWLRSVFFPVTAARGLAFNGNLVKSRLNASAMALAEPHQSVQEREREREPTWGITSKELIIA